MIMALFFFFQAEDGIRDLTVTGVQTCALPIFAGKRAKQLQEHSNFPKAGVYDPQGVGGTGVIYVLHDASQPELYGGLPANPRVPWTVKLWKGPLKWLGNVAMVGGLIGLFVHYLRFGPKDRDDEGTNEGGAKS